MAACRKVHGLKALKLKVKGNESREFMPEFQMAARRAYTSKLTGI